MTDPFLLSGKKALIAGTARGVGRTMAMALHEAEAAAVMNVLDGMESAAVEIGCYSPRPRFPGGFG
jgi:NAD(P)-dependent dehydrogenase (short-subunit alcohol dehydrogenase family)